MSDTTAKSSGPFSPRVMVAVLLVGVVAFGAFLVLSTYAPELRNGDDGRAHALSRSAIGYGALVRLLRETGVGVTTARSAPPADGQALWVLTPNSDEGLSRILEGRRGPTLIVLPKWSAPPSVRHAGWVGEGRARDLADVGSVLKGLSLSLTVERVGGRSPATLYSVGEATRAAGPLTTGPIDRLQMFAAFSGESPPTVEMWGPGTRPVLVRLLQPRANVWVLSDPDLLNNLGVADPRTASAGVAILQRLSNGRSVIFDVSLAGFERGRGLLRTAFEPPFLAATLCFLAAAALMGLHGAARFGARARTQRVFALGKSALADNAAGLIALAGREARQLPAYAADTRASVARDIGVRRDIDGPALDAALDRAGTQLKTTERWSQLNLEAQDASDPLAVAQRLWRWKGEMTRGRR